MRKTILALTAVTGVAAATLFNASHASGESLPSSKAAFAVGQVTNLSADTHDDTVQPTDTGWVDVMATKIRTANQKDLLFDVAMQCGLVTDSTVRSKNGELSESTARSNIAVRVKVIDEAGNVTYAVPSGSLDASGTATDGVVYCDRIQTLAAKFSGLDCTADATTGAVTCATEEELQLVLRTMDAHSFNFAAIDVASGVQRVVVEAKAASSAVDFLNGQSVDGLSGAEAFAGVGSLVVEEVRLVKDADTTFDLS